MQELWKDVSGYEGLYQVSNLGRVKRPCKRLLKGSICKNGYYRVTLWKDGKMSYKHIHRLVAMVFIPNPNNYPCINHKDEVKTNNNVDNLEWCSYYYNNNYKDIKKRVAATYSKNHSRAVEMLSLSGEKIREFSSVKEAAIFVGRTSTSIDRAIAKTRKTAYGYIWNLI